MAGVPAPTRLIISPDGEKVFICSRNTPTGDYTSYAVTPSAIFSRGTAGNLTVIQTVDTVGANPRECAITPDGKTLLEVDTDAGKLASYTVDSAGKMKAAAVAEGIDQPNAVSVWAAPSKCYCDAPAGFEATRSRRFRTDGFDPDGFEPTGSIFPGDATWRRPNPDRIRQEPRSRRSRSA